VRRLTNCDDLDNESRNGHSSTDWSSRVQYVRFAGNNGQGEVLGHVDTDEDSATSSSSSPSSTFSKVEFNKGDAAVELMNTTDDSFGLMEGGSSTGFLKKSESFSSVFR
jgi:hypothetical protein